ncbi:MAG: HK97 family phage prohead protease [Bacteroidota bacterium]|nr:HK97 family phage prohead protease [Bacteroidota bacterium]MDP4229807.1 HK97 family phage prohead protease [Bacteroidota bacterium]MDP4236928.1 HK97 family phage prohead protease [Bacteroidota bacterium]
MTNTQNNLESRYKNIPGKIIFLKNGTLTLAADTENEMNQKDLAVLNTQNEETDFSSPSRMKWLKVATSDPDRSGDEMIIEGAITDNFLRNPQFLWSHGQTAEPVHTLGKILKLVKTQDALYALAEYATSETSEFAEKIFQMDKAGYLPANSIGFRPIEWEPNEFGGYRFTKWELIEISKVELPCNPYAVDDGEPASKELTLGEAAEMI